MRLPTVSLPVFLLTLINVPKGGSSALLMTSSVPCCGSYASSSARLGSPGLVVTSPTLVGGLVLRSNDTTRLPPSVTNSQGKAATTPFGPAQSFAPAGGEHGVKPLKLAKICVMNCPVLASTTSTALFERSAR